MTLLPLLLFAAAPAATPPAPSPRARFDACVRRSDTDPAGALEEAKAWAAGGGGVPAGQCLGIARMAGGDWAGAADSFAATAAIAEQTRDARAADLWVSAGNAALAAGDAARGRAMLDKAIAAPGLADAMRGEAYLDRARAAVALKDMAAARTDMDQALALVPADPMAWLLSATLARRMGDLPRAAADIGQASQRAPNEPPILFEAGNIEAAQGHVDLARAQWSRARAADPASDAGQSAARALTASGGLPALPPKPGR